VNISQTALFSLGHGVATYYRYTPHNDVSVNDGPHIRRLSHKVIIAYSIQYSNMLYKFVA